MKKVFIVLLNWNNWEDTINCIDQLESNDYQNYMVVVVDNDSKERKNIESDKCHVIYNKDNLGFAEGNNIGIEYALDCSADYVLVLNSDIFISKDFLKKLVEGIESDNKIGFIGPKIYFADNREKIWYAGGNVNWLYNKGTMRGCGEIDRKQYDGEKIQETTYVTGCCLLARADVLREVGLMRNDYFLYYEDVDWSLRVKKAGYKCVFTPEAKIWHVGSKTSGLESPPYIYYMVRNGLILSHYFAPFYIKPFVWIDMVWRIKKQFFKLIFMPSKKKWAKCILLGIKDFILKNWGKNENWY